MSKTAKECLEKAGYEIAVERDGIYGVMRPITHQTRRLAYDQVKPKVTQLQAQVLAYLKRYGPLTTRNTATAMGVSILTVRPRMTELLQAGLVRAIGRNHDGALYEAIPEEEVKAIWEQEQKSDQLELL